MGWKLAAVNASDIAAMGGRPLWALLSLALPPGLDSSFAVALGRGLRAASRAFGFTLVGAAVSGALAATGGLKSELDAAVFAVFVSLGIAWTVWRLVPLALQRTAQAGQVAASAFEEFVHAAATVLRTPTLVWIFVGGALVTFAVNGLIAWAPSFMKRVHGMDVHVVGQQFGVFALAGGALGALAGGRLGDLLLRRWSGGRVFATGIGFVLGAPVCAALLLVERSGPFVPLLVATFFLYTWYNGPLSAVIFDVVPAAVRSSVIGAYVMFSHLAGDAVAPPLIGALSDRVGLRQAMLLLPAAGLVGGLLVFGALRTVKRDMARVAP
jgi:sugar phosphate permease